MGCAGSWRYQRFGMFPFGDRDVSLPGQRRGALKPDMVEYLSTEKPVHTQKIGLYLSSSVWIEAGSAITTVDHSDMRGLDTA